MQLLYLLCLPVSVPPSSCCPPPDVTVEADFCCPPSSVLTHCPSSAGTRCQTRAKADIILLVDGSWSIGRMNFKTIRNFIARTVSVFDIGPSRVQIGNCPPVAPPLAVTERVGGRG